MRNYINPGRLYQICKKDIADFESYGDVYESYFGNYVYIDRGSKVLGVAHLDSVSNNTNFNELIWSKGRVVFNEALDDRLGAYILLEVLPKYGIKCDVLLTENEERCNSTAQAFQTEKKYNWMFQFDRAGTDVVMYDYETDALQQMLIDEGFYVGVGSYSDICELEHLGCKGFNFGTGYYENHSRHSHAVLAQTNAMIELFLSFYKKHKDKYFNHVEGSGGGRWWSQDYYNQSACGYSRGWEAQLDDDLASGEWIEYETKRGRSFVPAWREKEWLKENPDGRRVQGYSSFHSLSDDKKWTKKSQARWEYDDEQPMNSGVYDRVFNYLLDEGYSTDTAHKEALLAGREAAEEDMSWLDDEIDICLVCGQEDCVGNTYCDMCGITVHGDRYAVEYGICSNCYAKMEEGGIDE